LRNPGSHSACADELRAAGLGAKLACEGRQDDPFEIRRRAAWAFSLAAPR